MVQQSALAVHMSSWPLLLSALAQAFGSGAKLCAETNRNSAPHFREWASWTPSGFSFSLPSPHHLTLPSLPCLVFSAPQSS